MSKQFNVKHIATLPKADFLKMTEHHKDEFDLEKIWEDAQVHKGKKAVSKPAK